MVLETLGRLGVNSRVLRGDWRRRRLIWLMGLDGSRFAIVVVNIIGEAFMVVFTFTFVAVGVDGIVSIAHTL